MGLFSSSKSKTSKITNTQNAGFSEVTGPALNIQGDSNAVSVLDGGAIAQSFDFAKESLDFSESAVNAVSSGAKESIKAITETARQETENITIQAMKFGLYAVAIWGGIQIFKGVKK